MPDSHGAKRFYSGHLTPSTDADADACNLVCAAQIDELHKMSALMGPPTMQTWPEGVLLAAGMGFSFNAQQPIPLHLMVRHSRIPGK